MELIDRDKLIEILAEMQGRCATKAALVQNSKIWQQVKDMPAVEIDEDVVIEYCRKRCLVIMTAELFADWAERETE